MPNSSIAKPTNAPAHLKLLTEKDLRTFGRFVDEHSSLKTYLINIGLQSRKQLSTLLTEQRKKKNNTSTFLLGAFVQERLVGVGCLIYEPSVAHYSNARIRIFTAPSKRRRGIGAQLNNQLIKVAKAAKIKHVYLKLCNRDIDERRFYTALGYTKTGSENCSFITKSPTTHQIILSKRIRNKSTDSNIPVLTTERLIIRPLTLADAPSIFNYASRPIVAKYTTWEAHEDVQTSKNYLLDYVLPNYANGIPAALAITLKSQPDTVIGTVGCFWVSQFDCHMELAYALSDLHWGKGYATEAAAAVSRFCIKKFALKRLQASCLPENTASSRVMQRIGMTYEGTLHSVRIVKNIARDLEVYALFVK